MSTFDPRFEPPETPGDWQTNYQPSGPLQGSDASRTAAVWVWVCSGIEMLGSSCCVLSGLILTLIPKDEILKLTQEAPNREQVIQMAPMFKTYGIQLLVFGLLLLLPAIAMAVMAFWVRKGGRGATMTCIVLLVMQGLLFALSVVGAVVFALSQGAIPDVCGILINLLILILIGKTVQSLWSALARPGMHDPMMRY